MQIVLIVIFAALLSLPSRAAIGSSWLTVTGTAATLAIACGLTLLIPLATGAGSWVCARTLRRAGGFNRAASLFGRIHVTLRFALLGLFALLVFQTDWLRVVRVDWHMGRYPLVDELVLIAPVLIAMVLSYLAMYPTDRALRSAAGGSLGEPIGQPVWTLGQYMDFQIRNQILTVVVPMSLFVLAADLMREHGRSLIRWTNVPWAPEIGLACVAGGIFVLAPLMLRSIWQTERLKDPYLRLRLEQVCREQGLRYRDILIWKSHGSMINAAVMGLIPQVRYILLSDGLLAHLGPQQVEAVFGHEAGHIRQRHMTYYMLFAIASMIGVTLAGDWIELALDLPAETVEMIVLGLIAGVWLVAFGWISRRFERQADIEGVRSLHATDVDCTLPCWEHNLKATAPPGQRVCTTAAAIFGSALEAVSALNGISKHARSWRHSSIASRQAFIRQAAFYPETLEQFERMIRRIKMGLIGVTLLLACVGTWYYWPQIVAQVRGPGHVPPIHRRQPPRMVDLDAAAQADAGIGALSISTSTEAISASPATRSTHPVATALSGIPAIRLPAGS